MSIILTPTPSPAAAHTFPVSTVIDDARRILNDETSTGYRWSDAELLSWVNACLRVMTGLRPDLFTTRATHTCVAGSEQDPAIDRMVSVVDVPRTTNGSAILPTQRTLLDAFRPGWASDTQGAAQNWMPHETSPFKFYLYPPAVLGAQVDVVAVCTHEEITETTDVVNLSDAYAPAITSFVVARAEAKEDEQVNSGRMQAFMSDFAGMLGVGGK